MRQEAANLARALSFPVRHACRTVGCEPHEPAPPDGPLHQVSTGEVEVPAREHGLSIMRVARAADTLGRPGVTWTMIAISLPGDGAGAPPLLPGVVLNCDGPATYKLGLPRAIAKVADLTASLGVPHAIEDSVEAPLDAVALNWERMYLPLVGRSLPQMPGNAGPDGLGFEKRGFRALLADGVTPLGMRVGSTFSGDRAQASASSPSRDISGALCSGWDLGSSR